MLKRLIRKIIYGYKATSETYVAHLKSLGVKCGENIQIFVPRRTTIDLLNPHLLEIGSNVVITGPTTVLTHDYSVFVANRLNAGRMYGKQQPVTIGSNVFLGWGSTILPGTVIGDNVIIGAGAVVSGKIEENSVYAGNPAKRICAVEEYIQRREEKQLGEAVVVFSKYYDRYGKTPDKSVFHEYFYLFSTAKELDDLFKAKLKETGNYAACIQYLSANQPMFENYEAFCEYAKKSCK